MEKRETSGKTRHKDTLSSWRDKKEEGEEDRKDSGRFEGQSEAYTLKQRRLRLCERFSDDGRVGSQETHGEGWLKQPGVRLYWLKQSLSCWEGVDDNGTFHAECDIKLNSRSNFSLFKMIN